MINLFQDVVTNLSLKNVIFLCRGVSEGHEKKITRPSSSFMINRTQLKFENHWSLKLQIFALCKEKYTHIHHWIFSKMSLNILVAWPVSTLRAQVRKVNIKCKKVFQLWVLFLKMYISYAATFFLPSTYRVNLFVFHWYF